jgi:hypothetical protein
LLYQFKFTCVFPPIFSWTHDLDKEAALEKHEKNEENTFDVPYAKISWVVFILYLPEDVLKSVLLFVKSTSVQKTLLDRILIYTFKVKKFRA